MPHPLSLNVTPRSSQGAQIFEPASPAACAADAGGRQTTAQQHYGAHRLDGLVAKQPSNGPRAATSLNEMPTEILANIFRGLPLSDTAQLSDRALLHHLKSQIEALPERERAPALTRIIRLQGKEAMTVERLFPRIQDGNVGISNRNYAIHLLNYGFFESEAAMLAGERDQHALENPEIEVCTAVFVWRPKGLPLHKFVSLLEQAIGEARRHGDKHSVGANDAIAGEERSRLVQRLRNLSGNAAPNAHPLSRPTLNRIVSQSTLDHIERLRTGA
ncbi:hypothetical protein [Mycetohabitans endofungorum]|uniref:hypothetical protein n=1 Tax=Mycetohabitans endofungorum TaxID=417203 RepID=UPI002B05BBBD|nr:hypothetical protein [Mycetohabitans endofungorum]